ncbi:hypothetical protein EVAR_98989_1 [Eumeta japonica]|uniref:Uncharacterized protein n=1 Tax=Eumeta variegata TaxID=151549 RepID=A0A4C1YMS1_EUMVA|nr:hypothetical protein EVAR_98989_1 [Eumeta japonica]
MNLAEEAATECDEAEEHAVHRTEDSARRVEAWIESTPPVVNVINAAANQAGIPRREGVADDAARTTLPDRVQPGSVARRKARTAVCHLLAANSKPEDIGSTRKKFGRPEQLVDEVLKEVKVMSRLTDSGREINDFAITTRNCVAVLQEIDEEGHIHNPVLLKEILEK